MTHANYKFSVTLASDDLAVVNCLRALAQYSQRSGNNRIPWGGTKDQDWKRAGHKVTFHFTTPEFRAGFVAEAQRLLPEKIWSVAGESNNDPAHPQT
jgi:hypothetical protein